MTADKITIQRIADVADQVEEVANRLQQLWFEATAGRINPEQAAAVAVQLAGLETIIREARA